MSKPAACAQCGEDWFCSSPDYGRGAEFAHYCPRTGRRETTVVKGYTKEMAYADAGRPDLAERFKS